MRTQRVVVIMAVIAIQAIALYWFCKPPEGSAGDMTPSDRNIGATTGAIRKRQASAEGLPVSRQRIDDFIDNVSRMDFEQCSMALHAPTSRDGADLVSISGVSGVAEPMGPSGTVARILADRRAAKMFALATELEPPAAESQAIALFDAKLKQHVEFWTRALQQAESLPQQNSAGAYFMPVITIGATDADNVDLTGRDYGPGKKFECATANHHALSVALLLVGCFCSPDRFLTKSDQWTAELSPIVNQVQGDSRYRMLTMEGIVNGKPDPLLLCNMMLMVASRAGAGGESQAEQVCNWPELGNGQATVVSFCTWDAKTNSSDFAHVHGFVPTSEGDVLTRFAVVSRWHTYLRSSEERKREFYERVRARFADEVAL